MTYQQEQELLTYLVSYGKFADTLNPCCVLEISDAGAKYNEYQIERIYVDCIPTLRVYMDNQLAYHSKYEMEFGYYSNDNVIHMPMLDYITPKYTQMPEQEIDKIITYLRKKYTKRWNFI